MGATGNNFLSMTSKIDLLRFSIEETRSALFCCHGRIEIKYLFSWLLQNNFLGVEMLFEIQKPRLTPWFFLFQTTFLHLGGYFVTNTKTRSLFLNYCSTKKIRFKSEFSIVLYLSCNLKWVKHVSVLRVRRGGLPIHDETCRHK